MTLARSVSGTGADTRSGADDTPRFRGGRRRLIVALASAVAVLASLAVPTSAASASVPEPDGLTAATAVASCWELKQLAPDAASGVYWLVTPALGAPAQFYCDQTTDGGGWVLVGRGRENWSQSNEGKGTPAQVSSTITGTAAFAPRQLSARLVDALLNDEAITSLDDGIRLRRATDTAGTAWQESTFTISSPRENWTWMFDNEQRLSSWNIGGVTGSGGTTSAFGSGTALNRIETVTGANQGWMPGFGYGKSTTGSTSASSYLWSSTTGYARPFTQVYLRPELSSVDIFAPIPSAGTVRVEQTAVAESFAKPTVWGVTGLGAGPNNVEGSNEVSVFAESNGVVYVGGNFTAVQRTSGGSGKVDQAYLAAFNVATGEWISSFRPTFNKQVKALAVLPNGDIAVGGYFDVVNGQSRPALVALNPTTGATVTTFTTTMINALSGGVPFVRSLDVQGNWLYIGGSFTHMTGGGSTTQVYARSAGRVAVATGAPDSSWNPEFNGTVMSLDASSQGDRVYYAGFFSQSKTTSTEKGAIITTANASVVPWTIDFSSSANYQQAVKEVGGVLWIGGSEHMLYSYNRTTLEELSTNIGKSGGDFQAISSDGSVIYAGCHCFYTNYSGARTWPSVGSGWTRAEKINSVGAWDNVTGDYLPQFSPTVSQRNGAGSWALFNDSTGTTWLGGDYTASSTSTTASQWSGGFVRFGSNDATAATTPTNLALTAGSANDSLSWGASTDARGSITYQVLRNDRVVATTTSTSATLPSAPSGTRYFVRAADTAGNLSASTPAQTVSAPPAAPVNLVTAGSSWKYSYGTTAPATGWNGTTFDASSWATGAAPLGYGHTTLGTTLTAAAPKPIAAYFRKNVTVTDAATLGSVTITTRADDGIVLYVNGVEVGRRNLDAGTVTSSTYANTAVSASAALANPVTFTVPASAFVTGENVISAEVHVNYRATPSLSFELTATAS